MFSLCFRPKSYLFERSNLKSSNVVREFDQLLMATCSRLTTRWSCYKTPGRRCWSSTTCTTGCITTCLTRLNCRTDRWTNLRILKLSWNRGLWKCRHCFCLKQDFPFCLNTSRRKFVTVFLCVTEVRAVEPGVAGGAVDGREVPRDLGQPQTALLRLRRLCLLEIHPLTQCR